jgi:hypothetical protein
VGQRIAGIVYRVLIARGSREALTWRYAAIEPVDVYRDYEGREARRTA